MKPSIFSVLHSVCVCVPVHMCALDGLWEDITRFHLSDDMLAWESCLEVFSAILGAVLGKPTPISSPTSRYHFHSFTFHKN